MTQSHQDKVNNRFKEVFFLAKASTHDLLLDHAENLAITLDVADRRLQIAQERIASRDQHLAELKEYYKGAMLRDEKGRFVKAKWPL